MTFLGLDSSQDDGKPVEFFEFILGTQSWYLTTADTEIVCDGHTYIPDTVSRTAKELTGELTGKRTTITLPGDHAISANYDNYVPPEPMAVTIRRQHRGDTDPIIVFIGVVRTASFEDVFSKLICEHISMGVGRVGLYVRYQPLCSKVWGSAPCGVSEEDFKTDLTVTSIDGTVVYCTTGQSTDYFTGGYVRFGDDYRMMTASSASLIEVSFPFEGLEVGSELTLYAGCDRSFGTCKTKFSNSINFGGCPYVPNVNVFTVGIR